MKLFKMSYQPRLKTEYKERVMSRLSKEFGYKNLMQVPKLEKIVLSRGVGAAVADKKLVDHAVDELTMISGQKPYQPFQKRMWQHLNFVRVCPLVLKLLYVVIKCMSSLIDW